MKDSALIEFAESVSKSLDNYADAMLMLADNCTKLAEHIVRLYERIESLERTAQEPPVCKPKDKPCE